MIQHDYAATQVQDQLQVVRGDDLGPRQSLKEMNQLAAAARVGGGMRGLPVVDMIEVSERNRCG